MHHLCLNAAHNTGVHLILDIDEQNGVLMVLYNSVSSEPWEPAPVFKPAVFPPPRPRKKKKMSTDAIAASQGQLVQQPHALQTAHGMVPVAPTTENKVFSGVVPFVIKKQMGKGAAKSAASRFAQQGKVAYLKVDPKPSVQVSQTSSLY